MNADSKRLDGISKRVIGCARRLADLQRLFRREP
jgi:hypothetical protein